MLNAKIKNIGMQLFIKNAWGSRRELPKFSKKSFREMWEERNSKN